mmetsp:Transcript_95828/g.266240  ORF Transcript_95828/g.266240 Transcript_95828/m.266240 type:complete len:345 (-) Transcript_95828:1-1035(-)
MHTVKSSRRETSAPCVKKLGTLVSIMVVQCLPDCRSPLGRGACERGSPRDLHQLRAPPAGAVASSWPDSPLPLGVGTEAEVSARVLWSDAMSRVLRSEVISAQSRLSTELCVPPANRTVVGGSGGGSTGSRAHRAGILFAAGIIAVLSSAPLPPASPPMPLSLALAPIATGGEPSAEAAAPPAASPLPSMPDGTPDESSSMVWAKRHVVPCLQRPLTANLHSLVLKNPAVARSSRSSCAKEHRGLSQVPDCKKFLHMLVQFRSGFSRISVRLCAKAQRDPFRHLFDRKNLHISVFMSCLTCFCRRCDLGGSCIIATWHARGNCPRSFTKLSATRLIQQLGLWGS